jgi:hypothetical protein
MERLDRDPVRPVMDAKLDLIDVLERLAGVMAGSQG